jgi:DNA recombination protein RmuC
MTEILLIVAVVLLVVVIVGQVAIFFRKVHIDLSPVEKTHERTEKAVRDEIAKNREESSNAARQSREELACTLKGVGDSLNQQLGLHAQTNSKLITDFISWQRVQFAAVVEQLKTLTDSNEKRLDAVKTTLEQKLKAMQDDNAKQLEEMRKTVDEKLHDTLEKRLGESFKLVSERLEAVHKGLGEMQTLATGVGDLKRVLTNVKARGTWGEVQLGRMLEEVLTPDQYATNVATKGDSERVEFAIKLPGRGDDKDEIVWLPIDAKFPVEDYQRLVEAQEAGDAEAMETASKQLEVRIKGCANDICSKYLSPPKTTDFGILFLPTEGLFAEVVRRPGLAEAIQRNHRVVIAGPTTLWSILNSLQIGFRTLAIQQRSSEVWNLLAAVKTEFGKYAGVLDQVKEKLRQASDKIDDVAVRSRAIGRKLKKVEELPVGDADKVLMLEGTDGVVEGDGEAE